MSVAILVSDIHIASPDEERCRQFIRLLAALHDDHSVGGLYLLGDIFDLWVADHDYFTHRYSAVVDHLRTLAAKDVHIAYFEGNHDLYLRDFWERELGFKVYDGPAYLTLGRRTVRLEHGDEMDPDDRGYLFLRWFLRTRPVRFLCSHLPGWLIARIGNKASAASRRYTSSAQRNDSAEVVQKVRIHARKAFGERPFDLLVSGHVHTRDDYEFTVDDRQSRSVNLGTWLDAPCVFRIDEAGARFVELSDIVPAAAPAPADRLATGG